MAKLFFSYSHKDEQLRDQLEVQLAMLKRQGVIETWHDRRITAGEDLDHAISTHVEDDDVILLLVSPDFLASDYCYDVEMTRVMERAKAGEAVVIPVILRPCDWHHAPFGKLRASPTDGKPVTMWANQDEPMLEVARDVRAAIERMVAGRGSTSARSAPATPATSMAAASTLAGRGPRSSNLAVAKTFTDHDRDGFLTEAFDYIATYFENSLEELRARNPGLQGTFRRVDANRFFATGYRDGRAVARATVFMGGMMGRGISYVIGETTESNGYNENLRVDADDHGLFLRSSGMAAMSGRSEVRLTFEGAAEFYWSMFIEPLQRN
ncbi:TIR domain-containing protein [Sphingomonas sp. CFBP 8760]|nr:TIR domain-containing protein [Sphingomonas sp. CFBP 8760]